MTRDDRIHGGLIVFNELFRCANANWERRYTTLKKLFPKSHHNKFLDTTSSSSVGSQLTTIVPRLKVPFVDKLGSTHLQMDSEQHNGIGNKLTSVRNKTIQH